jgi:uncharacterized membrane protein SirB2
MNYLLLAILIPLGAYDIILAAKRKTTISQAYQKLFPPVVDWIIFGVGIWLMWWAKAKYPELDYRLMITIAAFWGHVISSNRERHE